tara:strand:- start:1615 stop:2631 length:1017 start_codon:yes stop_codon:yes gene_type:complete
MLAKPLQHDEAIAEHITSFFAHRARPMPESVLAQAQIPEGAVVFTNEHGTAPGLAMDVSGADDEGSPTWLVMLPGPPRELCPMVEAQVLPFIQRKLPLAAAFHCRTLRSMGIGESMVEDQLLTRLRPLMDRGLDLGFCARTGQVDIRLCGHGDGVSGLIDEAEALIRGEFGKYIYGTDGESIAKVVVDRLIDLGETIAVAESCTGGFLGHHITGIPGASAVFVGGIISYSNELKHKLLDVKNDTLEKHGAVSKAVALEMAEGARAATGADHTLSITGIAGPGGGSTEKPVGTVWLGLASAGERPFAVKKRHPYNRETFKQASVNQSLELLRRRIQRDC